VAAAPEPEKREQILGVGGPVPAEDQSYTRIDSLNRHMDRLIEDAAAREKSLQDLVGYMQTQRSLAAARPSLWPVMGWVTSEFGRRTSPIGRRISEFHSGIDIATKLGAPILAPADGVVTEVAKRSDMGLMIVIQHERGIQTTYAHLFRAAVKSGQVVKRGEIVGQVGSSGRSTGAHLHYMVSMNGVNVNPRRFLP